MLTSICERPIDRTRRQEVLESRVPELTTLIAAYAQDTFLFTWDLAVKEFVQHGQAYILNDLNQHLVHLAFPSQGYAKGIQRIFIDHYEQIPSTPYTYRLDWTHDVHMKPSTGVLGLIMLDGRVMLATTTGLVTGYLTPVAVLYLLLNIITIDIERAE